MTPKLGVRHTAAEGRRGSSSFSIGTETGLDGVRYEETERAVRRGREGGSDTKEYETQERHVPDRYMLVPVSRFGFRDFVT